MISESRLAHSIIFTQENSSGGGGGGGGGGGSGSGSGSSTHTIIATDAGDADASMNVLAAKIALNQRDLY